MNLNLPASFLQVTADPFIQSQFCHP